MSKTIKYYKSRDKKNKQTPKINAEYQQGGKKKSGPKPK